MQHTPSSLRASLSRSTDGSEGSGGVLRLLQSSVPPEDLPLDGVKLACSVCIRRSMANSLVSFTCQFPSFLSPCPSWPATGTTPPASRHLQVKPSRSAGAHTHLRRHRTGCSPPPTRCTPSGRTRTRRRSGRCCSRTRPPCRSPRGPPPRRPAVGLPLPLCPGLRLPPCLRLLTGHPRKELLNAGYATNNQMAVASETEPCGNPRRLNVKQARTARVADRLAYESEGQTTIYRSDFRDQSKVYRLFSPLSK